jgi:hypothetical protein
MDCMFLTSNTNFSINKKCNFLPWKFRLHFRFKQRNIYVHVEESEEEKEEEKRETSSEEEEEEEVVVNDNIIKENRGI